ncbi:MAG: HU family DNA-binding protein [Candidatus Abyssobacteria bacterium SURF_5]|uniref:HU family DNA-binding protein n=1 Tax=Abyssobacteria bacterium (strain SURF_5) TaxID=2093360 RepID=A0A3A4PCI2_ABYX5|nr:MAG: HU family DNA-binding protein [Candidatus Abyssubacteria bacterium SURF_5]
MTKQELVDIVSEKSGLTKKETGTVVDIILNTITETMKRGEKVSLVGFGTFDIKRRKAREGRNPATGETIQIESRVVPSFKAGRQLKEALS